MPDFILEPLRERLDHPIVGYTKKPDSLTLALQNWLVHHYGWQVPEEWIVWLPGVVPGLNMAVNMLAADEHLLVPTPIYYPFLDLQDNTGRTQLAVPLALNNGTWSMDFARMGDALTPHTKMVCIANQQNPTGRCYSLAELQALAGFIEANSILLIFKFSETLEIFIFRLRLFFSISLVLLAIKIIEKTNIKLRIKKNIIDLVYFIIKFSELPEVLLI